MREITVYDVEGNSITSLVQWDMDVMIYIEAEDVGETSRVHFFNETKEQAMVVEGTCEDGMLAVKIPNDLLIEPYPVLGYVYVGKDGGHKSAYGFTLYMRKRPIPSDFIHEDSSDYVTVSDILDECRDLAKSAAESEKAAADSAASVTENANKAEEYKNAAADSATASAASASEASESANLASGYADDAKASADKAKQSEDNSKASEEAALASQEAAAASETNAKKSEEEAGKKLEEVREIRDSIDEEVVLAAQKEIRDKYIPEIQEYVAESGASRDAAALSEANSQVYESSTQHFYELTRQLSIANVGDITFSLDAERNCLTATFMDDDPEITPHDWYTRLLDYLEEFARSLENKVSVVEEYTTRSEESATSAAASAAQSVDSAAQALKSETNASASETSATASATSASESASSAKEYRDQAKTYSENAAGVTGIRGTNEETFRKGEVIISKDDIGLSNVENTLDADKHVAQADKVTHVFSVTGAAEASYDGSEDVEINIDKKVLGLDKVDNMSAQEIRAALTEAEVTDALGYTPASNTEVVTKPEELVSMQFFINKSQNCLAVNYEEG